MFVCELHAAPLTHPQLLNELEASGMGPNDVVHLQVRACWGVGWVGCAESTYGGLSLSD